jgi:O-antigen/teichoic acid export membrane protein
VFATLQAAVLIMAVVGCASLWLGISVMLPKHPRARLTALLMAVAWPIVLVAALALVLAAGVARGVGSPPALVAFVLVSLAVMVYTNVQGLPIGLNRIATYARGEIARAVVGVAVLCVLLVAGERQPSHVILIWGLASWGIAMAYLVAAGRPYAGRGQPTTGHTALFVRGAVSRSLRAHPNNVIALAVMRLDIVVLAALSSHEQVAFYSLAVAVSEGVWLVPGAFAVVGLADYSQLDPRAALMTARENLRRTLAAAAVTSAALFLAGALLITVFLRPAYHAAIVPLAITIAGALFYSATHAVNPWIVVTLDRPGLSSLIAGGTLALNMVLLLMLAAHGALGAAIASAIAYGFAGGVYVAVLSNHKSRAVRA